MSAACFASRTARRVTDSARTFSPRTILKSIRLKSQLVGSATTATGTAAAGGLRPRRNAAAKHERGADESGCANRLRNARTPMPGECARASSAELRGIHVCGPDRWEGRGHEQPAWMCGAIRHWDCRQFVQEGCSKTSYRNYNAGFFNASRLLV